MQQSSCLDSLARDGPTQVGWQRTCPRIPLENHIIPILPRILPMTSTDLHPLCNSLQLSLDLFGTYDRLEAVECLFPQQVADHLGIFFRLRLRLWFFWLWLLFFCFFRSWRFDMDKGVVGVGLMAGRSGFPGSMWSSPGGQECRKTRQ